MILIIAGSRKFDNYEFVKTQIYYAFRNEEITMVFSGGCSDSKNGVHTFTREDGTKVYGVDGLGERWAKEHDVPVRTFDADWKRYGNAAGPIRNNEMGKEASKEPDSAVAIIHDGGPGSKSMITIAEKYKLKGFAINYLTELNLSKN